MWPQILVASDLFPLTFHNPKHLNLEKPLRQSGPRGPSEGTEGEPRGWEEWGWKWPVLRRRDREMSWSPRAEGCSSPPLLHRVSGMLLVGLDGKGALIKGSQRRCVHTHTLLAKTLLSDPGLLEWARGPQQGVWGQVWPSQGQEDLTCITTACCLHRTVQARPPPGSQSCSRV